MIKLVIFDLDYTLRHETIYPQVYDILEYLKGKNIKLAIASFNPYSNWFCDRYSIQEYFDIIIGKQTLSKTKHINEILYHYKKNGINISPQEIIFADDDLDNIYDINNNFSINCIKVNPLIGIQLEQIKKILK